MAASSLRSHLISFWSPQLWMLLSHLQNETQRLHQKPSCLSDAAYCNTGQLRWMSRPLRSCWKRLAFFSLHIFIPYSHYLSEEGWVCAQLTATGSNHEKKRYVDIMPTILLFFSHLCPTEKNSWRAWIVLKILFQPLSHTGPRSLFGLDRSRITESYSQLHMTQSETQKNTQEHSVVNFPR